MEWSLQQKVLVAIYYEQMDNQEPKMYEVLNADRFGIMPHQLSDILKQLEVGERAIVYTGNKHGIGSVKLTREGRNDVENLCGINHEEAEHEKKNECLENIKAKWPEYAQLVLSVLQTINS